METRKITVVTSASQSRYEIQSAATTLSELKRDLSAANVDYDGMTFMVGVVKVELKDDSSILPTNVPMRDGSITNDLYIMLTPPQKKIKSGVVATRSEAYNFLKTHSNAASTFKAEYGVNYTNGKTVDLVAFVNAQELESVNVEGLKTLVYELYNDDEITDYAQNAILAFITGEEPKVSDEEIQEMFEGCLA